MVSNTRQLRPSSSSQDLLHLISEREARFQERRGSLERDADDSYLTLDGLEEDPLQGFQSYSMAYWMAIGSQRGRNVSTLQTIPPQPKAAPDHRCVAKLNGFSLHARVVARAHQRNTVERLSRYMTRPAVLEQRLSLTPSGKVRCELKTRYLNGVTHVIFEPLVFIARLAALVPKSQVNLVQFRGVFIPNGKHRALITTAGLVKGSKNARSQGHPDDKTSADRYAAMATAGIIAGGARIGTRVWCGVGITAVNPPCPALRQ